MVGDQWLVVGDWLVCWLMVGNDWLGCHWLDGCWLVTNGWLLVVGWLVCSSADLAVLGPGEGHGQ